MLLEIKERKTHCEWGKRRYAEYTKLWETAATQAKLFRSAEIKLISRGRREWCNTNEWMSFVKEISGQKNYFSTGKLKISSKIWTFRNSCSVCSVFTELLITHCYPIKISICCVLSTFEHEVYIMHSKLLVGEGDIPNGVTFNWNLFWVSLQPVLCQRTSLICFDNDSPGSTCIELTLGANNAHQPCGVCLKLISDCEFVSFINFPFWVVSEPLTTNGNLLQRCFKFATMKNAFSSSFFAVEWFPDLLFCHITF